MLIKYLKFLFSLSIQKEFFSRKHFNQKNRKTIDKVKFSISCCNQLKKNNTVEKHLKLIINNKTDLAVSVFE